MLCKWTRKTPGLAPSEALLGYWFGAGKMNLINGMPHGPILQALTCRRWFLCVRLCIWSYLNVALSRFNSRVSWRCQQICPTSRWRFFERSSQEFQLCSHESVAMNIGNQDDLMFFGQKVGMMVHSIHYTMVDDCTEVSHRAHCNGRESVQFRGPPKPVQFLRHQNMVNMTQERETWLAHSSLDSLGLPSLTHIFEKYHLVIQHSSGKYWKIPIFDLGTSWKSAKNSASNRRSPCFSSCMWWLFTCLEPRRCGRPQFFSRKAMVTLGIPILGNIYIYIYTYMAF